MLETILIGAIIFVASLIGLIILIGMISSIKKHKRNKREKLVHYDQEELVTNQQQNAGINNDINQEPFMNVESDFELENISQEMPSSSLNSLKEDLNIVDNNDFELESIVGIIEAENSMVETEEPTISEEYYDEDGVVLIGKGDSRVTGSYGFLPAGEYIVESAEGIEPFKVRIGRNVNSYNSGDKIVLIDKYKVVPINSSIRIKK